MSDFEDAIGDMATDFLVEAGSSFVYRRGSTTSTITLRKAQQPSYQIDSGNGSLVEVTPVDFIGLTLSLPFDPPERGDRISAGGMIYEVQPTISEKVFRRISPQMTRIHTKQVK